MKILKYLINCLNKHKEKSKMNKKKKKKEKIKLLKEEALKYVGSLI